MGFIVTFYYRDFCWSSFGTDVSAHPGCVLPPAAAADGLAEGH